MLSLQRILCPVDFSVAAKLALDYAVALSQWYGARLTVLHVFSELPVFEVTLPFATPAMSPVMARESDIEPRREALRGFTSGVPSSVAIDLVVQEAPDVRAEILRHAAADKTDLIVMGTHGRSGVQHLLLGSVTERVMRKASCPVLIVPPHAPEAGRGDAAVFKRIVCGVDFSAGSTRALQHALALAQESDSRLTLLHAIEFPLALREVAFSTDANVDRLHAAAEVEYARRLRALVPPQARTYCTVMTRVNEGKPAREIQRVAAAEQADLIVMGAHGRGAMDLMVFGSNTHAVICDARCPILVVPAT